jgi:hypothetical protein
MRKIFFILAMSCSCAIVFAQEPADALRYSWITPRGTARQQAVGGAMTSLGGDLSATFVNPAGLGFYKTGDFVLTPGFFTRKTKAHYYGRDEFDRKSPLSFGTSGVVFGTGTNYNNKKNYGAAVALAVNRTAEFGSRILYRGVNTQNSYSQKFLEEIQGGNVRDANAVAGNYPFGTSLAFNTFWIDTVAGGSSNNYQFKTRAPIGNLIQENQVENYGGITEVSLAVAGNNNDKIFFGGAIGVPFLNYTRESSFTEADGTTNTANNFDFARIDENLTTSGVGVNLKMGVIYKPVEYVRLGLAVHTPTFYMLTDRYNASVTTNTENYKGQFTQNSGLFTGGSDAEFDYVHITPYRIMASGSYVFREIQDVRKQRAFITADVEYVNYKSSSFSRDPDDTDSGTKTYFKTLNNSIDNAYKSAFNFKAGGELKFTTVMARLGLAYYGNPYRNLGHEEKGDRFSLSGGLGYRNKGVFVDLTYVHTMGKDVHFAYRLQNAAYTGATLKQTGGNVLLTVGFKI